MLSHRPTRDADPAEPRPNARSTRKANEEAQPMNADWLEERALSYVSRWEASEAGVAALLERKISERCERTQESPDLMRSEIAALIARLVERNYVSDQRFAEVSFTRQRKRGASTARIRASLLAKGISEKLLDTLFDHEEPGAEARAAWAFAKRRGLGPYHRDRRGSRGRGEGQENLEASVRERLREKHLSAFGREGFDFELAKRIMDAVSFPEAD